MQATWALVTSLIWEENLTPSVPGTQLEDEYMEIFASQRVAAPEALKSK